jgi:hypothetical protein
VRGLGRAPVCTACARCPFPHPACLRALVPPAALTAVLCVFSLNSWIAIIIKNMLAGTALANTTSSGGASSVNTLHATLYSAIPYGAAAVAMWTVAWSSARFKEKDLHTGVPWMFGGVCLALFAPLYRASFAAGFAVIVLALTSAYSSQSVIFARVTGGQRGGVGACMAC